MACTLTKTLCQEPTIYEKGEPDYLGLGALRLDMQRDEKKAAGGYGRLKGLLNSVAAKSYVKNETRLSRFNYRDGIFSMKKENKIIDIKKRHTKRLSLDNYTEGDEAV